MPDDFYRVDTGPDGEPVTLAEAKAFMRVENTVDDDLIEGLLDATLGEGEDYTNRAFITRTITGFFSGLAVSDFEAYPFVQIRRAPLASIISVKVTLNDTLEDVDSDDYQLKESSEFSRVLFTSTPNCDDIPYPLQIQITAGYGVAANVPERLKTAMKQHALFLYENRGDVAPDGKIPMPLEVQAMYSKYRILNTF